MNRFELRLWWFLDIDGYGWFNSPNGSYDGLEYEKELEDLSMIKVWKYEEDDLREFLS